jgi:hypothetical protein
MIVSLAFKTSITWNPSDATLDVEHAATATGGVAHGAGAPPMRYEGFEPSPYDQQNARENELGIVCPQSYCSSFA